MTSDSLETSDKPAAEGKDFTTEDTSETGSFSDASNDSHEEGFEEKSEEATQEPLLLSTTHSIPNPLLNFEDVGFSPSLQNVVTNVKWKTPRPLDGMALPRSLVGEDLVIQAASKTSAIIFLTLAHRLEKFKDSTEGPHALVVYSSIEGATRACQDYIRLFGDVGLSASVVEEDYENDEESTETKEQNKSTSFHIAFASPTSVKSACAKNQLTLDKISICICRDVDDVKEAGTIEVLEDILTQVRDAQKILFSKTLSLTVKDLSAKFLKNPTELSLERERATIASISHRAFLCETPNKFKTLLGLMKDQDPKCAVVFANNKMMAAWLFHKFNDNSFAVEHLSGDTNPQKRSEMLENVQSGKTKIIVTTDYDSRNFNPSEITHVFNFDLPDSGDGYLSRMGLIGKDAQGFVYSLVCDEYGQNYQHVYDLLGQKAPKPIWAKEEYLSIVDKAGNPFLEKDIGFVDKRPGRDFGDRPRRGHDGDRERPSFSRNRDRGERGERPDRDRSDRGERGDRPERERMGSRGPRIEERQDRFERVERNDRDRAPRGERIEQRNDRIVRNDRSDRNDRGDRDDKRSSSGPQIKPRTRRPIHSPTTQGRPTEKSRLITPREPKKGVLNKIMSFFFSKKK